MSVLIYALAQIVLTVINIYIWVVIIAVLLSFVRPDPYNPVVQALYKLTEPVFEWIRRKMPFVVVSGLDLSPLVLLLALQFIEILVRRSML